MSRIVIKRAGDVASGDRLGMGSFGPVAVETVAKVVITNHGTAVELHMAGGPICVRSSGELLLVIEEGEGGT